jgi:hypothetical protein
LITIFGKKIRDPSTEPVLSEVERSTFAQDDKLTNRQLRNPLLRGREPALSDLERSESESNGERGVAIALFCNCDDAPERVLGKEFLRNACG